MRWQVQQLKECNLWIRDCWHTVNKSCHGLVIPSPSSFGFQNLPFPIAVLPHSSRTPLYLQGSVSFGHSKKQQVVLMCWETVGSVRDCGNTGVAGAGRKKDRAWKWDEGCEEAIKTGKGLYVVWDWDGCFFTCVPQPLHNTMSREGKPALQPLRVATFWWWPLQDRGQSSSWVGFADRAMLSLSSSAPFGELGNSSRPLLKSRFMGQLDALLLCPKLILIWLRKCHDEVLTSTSPNYSKENQVFAKNITS